MKIKVIAVGKDKNSVWAEAINEYKERIGRYADIEIVVIETGDKESESEAVLKKIDDKDYVVVLDEFGEKVSSCELSQFLDKAQQESVKNLVFVIGGAYGVSDEVKSLARKVVSMSDMTFPHLLARAILLEQIYRAFSILRGEKYHHE